MYAPHSLTLDPFFAGQGSICKCFDESVDGLIVSDELRKVRTGRTSLLHPVQTGRTTLLHLVQIGRTSLPIVPGPSQRAHPTKMRLPQGVPVSEQLKWHR